MYSFVNLKNYISINRLFAWHLAILAAIIFLLSAIDCFAAVGNLDRTFGDGGKAIAYVNGAEKALDVIVQPDGKVVVVGGAAPDSAQYDFLIARYNANGTPDSTFGTNGKVVWSNSSLSEVAYAVTLQSDGKIVVAGYVQQPNNHSDYAIIRLLPNGQIDSSFGSAGVRIISPTATTDIPAAIAMQTVGGAERILVGGYIGTADVKFCVTRLNLEGNIDVTFGDFGHKAVGFGGGTDVLQDMTIDAQGRIVAAGWSRFNAGGGSFRDDFAVTRLTAHGTLDTSFSDDGMLKTQMQGLSQARAVTMQNVDGLEKIVVGGFSYRGSFTDFAFVRYNPDGTIDTSFGTSGKVYTDFAGHDEQLYELLAQADGKISAVGFMRFGVNQNFALTRLNRDGSLDTTFGSCGRIVTDLRTNTDIAYAATMQPDGKIIAVGESMNGSTSADFTTVRYTTGGQATATGVDFDGDGKTDVSVFRPSNGVWYQNCSCAGNKAAQFGQVGDIPVPADYDGDGRTDQAVYRGGYWYINQSQAGFRVIQFGTPDDVPTVGDYDGDERADIAVFRPSNGYWYIFQSSTNLLDYKTFGQASDKPVQADYDRDGKTDVAVYRPSSGTWYVLKSSDASFAANQFGSETDAPVVGDFDGDGKADLSVFRPSNGMWFSLRTVGGQFAYQFGATGDVPVASDYDGDNRADIAVYRGGAWYIQQSTAGFRGISFGAANDIPLAVR